MGALHCHHSTGIVSKTDRFFNEEFMHTLVHPLETAKHLLLEPGGLRESDLERVLGLVMGRAVDFADLYFQSARHETWVLEDGIIRDGRYNIDCGVGVRAISGEKTGFAYSADILPTALNEAALAARSIALQGGKNRIQVSPRPLLASSGLYPNGDPIKSLENQRKIELLRLLDAEARKQDPRIKEVIVSLVGVYEVILVVDSEGTFNADIRPLVRLNVSVIAEENGKREQGSHGGGGRDTYDIFWKDDLGLQYAREAVRIALVNLKAAPAPAGTMPVVLGPGWPGVLLHEAIGHGLEGDFNRKGSSAFAGRIGERVASPLCTVVDDGTVVGRRGSLNMDDEGTKTQCTTLIEKGILKGYLQDKLNAKLMGMPVTGNGRRESYAHLTLPRMTNTYMLAGQHAPEEIIASVKKGLYAVNFGGGQVDITSGKFVFNASEAYLVENGKIIKPVKGATLIGNGPDILMQVSMVGNDLRLDTGVGVCGKEGQSVPVGVGQPTLKIENMTVGGTVDE
jgi:TldD protein